MKVMKGDIIEIKKGEKRIQTHTGEVFWTKNCAHRGQRGGMKTSGGSCFCKEFKSKQTCKHVEKETIWFNEDQVTKIIKESSDRELIKLLPEIGKTVWLKDKFEDRGQVFWRGIGKGGKATVGFKSKKSKKTLFASNDEIRFKLSKKWNGQLRNPTTGEFCTQEQWEELADRWNSQAGF